MPTRISVPLETRTEERRVALVPDVVARLARQDVEIRLQNGAGEGAGFSDADYEAATLVAETDALYRDTDIVLTVNPPDEARIESLPDGVTLIGFLDPYGDPARFRALADKRITALAMELIPRISRAQAMDALSSQASVAGYKAVLRGANLSGKFFPMLTTAAGTVRPSRVLVIGAGVAGLQAIATARRLGAVVEAYDVRPEVKEQVESLGARFVDVSIEAAGSGGYARELTAEEKQQQADILASHVAQADVLVTTAAVPGRQAPRIITTPMVEAMKGGAVIVDLAAETGGNCELTRAGETITHGAVTIDGPVNVPASVPTHASELYARNLQSLLGLMLGEQGLQIDREDQVIGDSLVTDGGEIVNPAVRERLDNGGAND